MLFTKIKREKKTNTFIRKISFYVLLVTFFIPSILLSQENVGGKPVVSGVWKGKTAKYMAGSVGIKLKNGAKIEFPDSIDVMAVISELKKSEIVEIAEPNLIGKAHLSPNDEYFNDYQWALRNISQDPPNGTEGADINIIKAWDITTGSPDVLIAVLDSGIPMEDGSLSHPDLDDPNKFILGEDCTSDPDQIVRDYYGHGTHVAGIIGAETNNTEGIAGVVWNCKLLIVQVFQNDYFTTQYFYDAVHSAVDYAQNHNYRLVINFSGGWFAEPELIESAIEYADSYNVTIVTSVGNRAQPSAVDWPAAYSSSYDNVIAVSATDHNDEFADLYSNAGSEVNVSAPGGWGWGEENGKKIYNGQSNLGKNIYSTFPNYSFNLYGSATDATLDYGYLAGTSMAAPHVSGVVGLILSINPNLTPSQVRTILQQSTDKVAGMGGQNFTNNYGYGRINAYKALKYTLENYGGTLSGNVTFTEDLTIASGKLLTVELGTTVKFANGKQLIVHGRIVAEDATFQPVSGTWNGILIDGSSASSFDNCTITGAKFGLTFGGSAYVYHQVDHCNIEGKDAAVWIKSYSDPTINNSFLKTTGYIDVVLSTNNSNGKIRDCKIYADNYQVLRGHKNMNSASPCYGDIYGLNIIDGTKFTTGASSIYVSGGFPYFNYGYNSILSDQYLYQYSNYSGSTRYAYNNYWGGGAPVVQGNTVIYSGYLSNPNPDAGPNWSLSKNNFDNEIIIENNPLADAWKEYNNRSFAKSKEMAKELFENNSKEEQSCEILFLWMKSSMCEGTLKEEEDNLLSLSKNSSINELAQYESLRWLAKLAVRNGDIEKAENYASSIPNRSLMGREILFDVADEIMENWGDLGKASAILNKITERYTDNETLKEKQFVLSLYTDNIYAYSRSNKNEPQVTENKDNSFNLSEAYPNPFNPATIISYTIPNDGMVTLKVYDILGREVATLVNEGKPAGTYTVNFNGDNLASGIYNIVFKQMKR